MKTAEKEKEKESSQSNAGNTKHTELRTQQPLSEKDEVKQAEASMRKPRRGLL
jgi:hypothetical protein